MTDEEIYEVWKSVTPQGDSTGKKFSIAFGKEIAKIAWKEGKLAEESLMKNMKAGAAMLIIHKDYFPYEFS